MRKACDSAANLEANDTAYSIGMQGLDNAHTKCCCCSHAAQGLSSFCVCDRHARAERHTNACSCYSERPMLDIVTLVP